MVDSKLINNTYRVKLTNAALIRKTIKAHPGLTRAEISRETGLSIATCRNILTEMVEQNEIIESDPELEGSVGRPAKKYTYNGDYSYVAVIVLHVDSDGKFAYSNVANFNGDIVFQNKFKIHGKLDLDGITAHLDMLFEMYPNISSLAIALPGTFAQDGRVIYCDYHELDDAPLGATLERNYDVEVHIANTSALTAFGYQSEKHKDGRVFVSMLAPENCNLGLGITIDNRIFMGDSGLAGEVSFGYYGKEEEQSFEALLIRTNAAITLLGPKVMVFTGNRFNQKLFNDLVNRCKEELNPIFWPEFIYLEDPVPYLINGAINFAISSLNKTVQVMV